MENYELYNDFKDSPIIFQEILYKKFMEEETGCIDAAIYEYHSLLLNKEVLLSELYDTESIKYLKIEKDNKQFEFDLSKEYFLSNKFIFLGNYTENNTNYYDDLKKFKSKDGKISFYIFLVGACELDYDCCTSTHS